MEKYRKFTEWESQVPTSITFDSLWSIKAYRLALFAADIAWQDCQVLINTPGMRGVADQLYRAIGSIGANIAEGYSRSSGRERAHFYEYALGSAREARDWYFKARLVYSEQVIEHRLGNLTEIIRLLLTMVPDQRARTLKEAPPPYGSDEENGADETLSWGA